MDHADVGTASRGYHLEEAMKHRGGGSISVARLLKIQNTNSLNVGQYTNIDRLNLAEFFKQVGEVLLSSLLINLPHPQRRTAYCWGKKEELLKKNKKK